MRENLPGSNETGGCNLSAKGELPVRETDDGKSELTRTAPLFTHDGSQAVRLPADCRFEGDRVSVRRGPRAGDMILSSRAPSEWREFMKLREELGPLHEDLLAERLLNAAGALRDPFARSDA